MSIPPRSYWAPALITFSRISGWIVAPIVAALLVGKHLDKEYGTNIKYFLICAGVALFITLVGIYIEVRRYIYQLEKDEKNKQ